MTFLSAILCLASKLLARFSFQFLARCTLLTSVSQDIKLYTLLVRRGCLSPLCANSGATATASVLKRASKFFFFG